MSTKTSRITAIDVELGRRLNLVRKLYNVSQKQIARHLEVSYQQLQKYENGENRIPVRNFIQICALYNLPYSFFLDDLDKPDDFDRLIKTRAGGHDPALPAEGRGHTAQMINLYRQLPDEKFRALAIEHVKLMVQISRAATQVKMTLSNS